VEGVVEYGMTQKSSGSSNNELRMVCKTVNKHGITHLSLIRLRNIIMEGGLYSVHVFSLYPLPSTKYLSPKEPSPQQLLLLPPPPPLHTLPDSTLLYGSQRILVMQEKKAPSSPPPLVVPQALPPPPLPPSSAPELSRSDWIEGVFEDGEEEEEEGGGRDE